MINFRLFLRWVTLFTISIAGCGVGGQSSTSSTHTAPATQALRADTALPAPASGDSQIRMNDGMPMKYVPAGAFLMGSAEDEVDYALEQCRVYGTNCRRSYFSVEIPQHIVELDGFWIDQTEVSWGQYQKCVTSGTCPEAKCQDDKLIKNDDHPVVCVTWHQAVVYCEWAQARLPSEAEWEYAARGADESRYPWGDQFDGTLLNYCDVNCSLPKRDETFDDGFATTAPVGSYPGGASWIGALDMAGNVWEIVADWNGPYSPEKQTNPLGPESGGRRVARGGSWHASPDHVRSTLRTHMGPDDFIDHAGFRCVQSAE